MKQASNGDTVKVHYTGRLEDGTQFDSSINRQPLEFTLGNNQVVPGFEDTIVGMTPGESKTERIAAKDAYGLHREELMLQVDRSQFPDELEPEVNRQVQLSAANGNTLTAKITGISGSNVTLDANHPLAGKDLTFDIQLVEIV